MSQSERNARQEDLLPSERLAATSVAIIGVGAVGRQLALQLASAGVGKMTLLDDDQIEELNLGPQGYRPDQIGQSKVAATGADCLRQHPDLKLLARPERCHGFVPRADAIFSCVDGIQTRAELWKGVRRTSSFFADSRIAGETIRILTSCPPHGDAYQQTLFSAPEAFQGRCTSKATIYTAALAASLLCAAFSHWLVGGLLEDDLLLSLSSWEIN